jgi:hypothetical protein
MLVRAVDLRTNLGSIRISGSSFTDASIQTSREAPRRDASNAFKLEADAETDLDLPVASWFLLRRAPTQLTETTSGEAGPKPDSEKAVRVQKLIVVENVSEDALQFQANALRHFDILPDA